MFYSRLRELGLHAKLEQLEEDLVKGLFISNMHGSNIQMELISEVRTPQQVLNYAINRERKRERERERKQANQQEIHRAHSNWSTVTYVRPNKQQNAPTTQKPQKSTPCRKCDNPFNLAHLQICPAKLSNVIYARK